MVDNVVAPTAPPNAEKPMIVVNVVVKADKYIMIKMKFLVISIRRSLQNLWLKFLDPHLYFRKE